MVPFFGKFSSEIQGYDIYLIDMDDGKVSWIGSRRNISQANRYLKYLGVIG
jgi:hypothetical protein